MMAYGRAVTPFGIFLTPVFYYLITWFGHKRTTEVKLVATKQEPAHEPLAAQP